jgi:hypothetical protein
MKCASRKKWNKTQKQIHKRLWVSGQQNSIIFQIAPCNANSKLGLVSKDSGFWNGPNPTLLVIIKNYLRR